MIVFIVGKVSYHKEDRKEYPTGYKERTKIYNGVTCEFRNHEDRNREPEILRFVSLLIDSLMENGSKKKKSTNSSGLVIEVYIRYVIISVEDCKGGGAKTKAFNHVEAKRSED